MHGHFDRSRSVLSGHIAQTYGNWPMASCYFVHCSVVADFPILLMVSMLYLGTKNVAKSMRKISCGAKKTEEKSWFVELSNKCV